MEEEGDMEGEAMEAEAKEEVDRADAAQELGPQQEEEVQVARASRSLLRTETLFLWISGYGAMLCSLPLF